MVQKTMDLHVLPSLTIATTVFASFDLWMFKGGVDIFALLINYLDERWIPWDAIIGLFEVQETRGNTITSRNQPKCNHSIYDYMQLVVVCD